MSYTNNQAEPRWLPSGSEIDDEKIQQLLQGDHRGMAVLLEPILNQILQAEMTEHLGAEPG